MVIVSSLLVLGIIGALASVLLYAIAQKFKVEEDPRIDLIEAILPGANCGGCGFPGCRGLAVACAKAGKIDGLMCPVGGQDVMDKAAEILGAAPEAAAPAAAPAASAAAPAKPRTLGEVIPELRFRDRM